MIQDGRKLRVGLTAILVAVSLAACSQPAPPTPTFDAALMSERQAQLDALAEQLKIGDQPDIPLIRFVDSSEWLETQLNCLEQAGYPVKATSDGQGIDFSDIPAAQSAEGSPLYFALYTCQAQYSPDPRDSQPLSDVQLSALYDYYTKTQVPCLEEHGIAVEPAPSRQTFIETYFSKTNPGWLPYDSVDLKTMTDETWGAINRDCPQSPDNATLYGG